MSASEKLFALRCGDHHDERRTFAATAQTTQRLCEPRLTFSAGQIESNYDETTDSFDNMNLKAELLRGVYAYGFERPSAIQQRAIMPVIKGMCPPQKLTTKRAETYKQ